MRLGGSIKTKLVAGSLAAFIISFSALPATTYALDLGSSELNVPLGGLGKPVTDLLNPITEILPVPITVNSTETDLGAEVTLPNLSNTPKSEPEVSANLRLPQLLSDITEPVSQLTTPILEPVVDAVTPITQPLANALRPITQPDLDDIDMTPAAWQRQRTATPTVTTAPDTTGTLVVQKSTDLSLAAPTVAGASTTRASSDESDTVFSGISQFLNSALPGAFSGFIGKTISPLAIIISSVVLMITIVGAGIVLYTSRLGNNTRILGSHAVAKFAQVHDINQLTAFAIAVVGFGVVAVVLAFAGL